MTEKGLFHVVQTKLLQVNPLILQDAKQNNFAGYDPFDGLNSVIFNLVPALKKGIFGLAWIQLHKRSPINLPIMRHSQRPKP